MLGIQYDPNNGSIGIEPNGIEPTELNPHGIEPNGIEPTELNQRN